MQLIKLNLQKKFMPVKTAKGFSKLSKEAKIEWLANEYLKGDDKS